MKTFSETTQEKCNVQRKCYGAIKQTFTQILLNQKQTTGPLSSDSLSQSQMTFLHLLWAASCPNWHSANFKFLAFSRPNECNKYRYRTHQFEWHKNLSCLCNDCNNNCNNDSSPRNCNYERAKISDRQVQSNSNSTQDKKPKHSASRQKGG